MFTEKDIEIMTLPYFKLIRSSDTMYEIQSRCTGHCWAILPLSMNKDKKYYKLLHKYRKQDLYHPQTDLGSVLDIILYVIDHDDYKLHRKSKYFDEILSRFSES